MRTTPGPRTGPRTLRHSYGPASAQAGELYLPPGGGPHPVVVLVHGGFWAAIFDRTQTAPLAEHLAGRGYAVWNIGYRGVGEPGGGWPGTLLDTAAAVDALADLAPYGLDLERVVAVGHSAGGHLACWSAARGRLPAGAVGAGPRVRVRAAVSVAGVVDLRAGHAHRVGAVLADRTAAPPPDAPVPGRRHLAREVLPLMRAGAVAALLGGGPEEVPGRYGAADPAGLLPSGAAQLLVHGTADAFVPVGVSRGYARAARAAGDRVDLVELPGGGHFDVLDPAGAAWRTVVERLPGLAAG
ncbi:alpha/beta hydrolase family protein [Streptomyces goshikiensis]|uniref:alpha/beta hydrolase family protein n=1 Tax=Streptomyces goshikiensis TaxID=1942 RepID=UPI003710E346